MANTSNDIITIYSNTGLNVGVPASTTIGGLLVYTFNSTYSYSSGVLEVNIVDAEGGVKVGFNDVELYSLKDDDNLVSVFTVRLPEIVVGTNKIQIWSTTSDGATLKGLVVKAGVKLNIARTGKINKIIDKVKLLYDFYNTTTVEGIAGLPPIPTKLGKRSKLAKSKNVEDLKMQILDGGINVLLDMYQEVKMNKGNNRQFNNPKSNNIKKKFNFKL